MEGISCIWPLVGSLLSVAGIPPIRGGAQQGSRHLNEGVGVLSLDYPSRKWWILSVVTLVAFITNVDGTIVIVGLPRIIGGLHISFTVGLWTLTAYILTSTVLLLPAGRMADRAGPKRVFMVGLAVFTASTTLCGFAPSGTLLILFRLIQGGGAALALATATPIIVRAFPPNQLGQALGINSTSWVIGSIVGPVAGGALVGSLGWRWIFFVTVPFAVAGIVGAWLVLVERAPMKVSRRGLDWFGAFSFAVALTAILVALSEGAIWGFTSVPTLGLFGLAGLLLVGFVRWELASKNPLFDFHLFRHRHYRSGLGVTMSYSIGYFASTFLLTIYLQGALHQTPLASGLLLIPLSAPQLIMGPVGGTLADRLGPARLVLAGIVLLGTGAFLLGDLGPHLSPLKIIVPLLVMSFANGLAWPSLTKAVMSSLPSQQTGIGSGMFYTFRNIGMALSLTLAFLVSEASLPAPVASRVFLGTAGILSPKLEGVLVHSTDVGFHFFVGFYVLAFVLAIALLRPMAEPRLELDVERG